MKNIFILLVGVLALAACSSPKYTYNFDHYDYNSGKRKKAVENTDMAVTTAEVQQTQPLVGESPLTLQKEDLVGNADQAITPVVTEENSLLTKKYTDLSRSEKKEFRKELKTEIRKYMKAKKDGTIVKDAKVMDYNLKMAIIFGAVALTLSFFGGVNSAFWIASVIALVIGVVFFIKWIAEQ